MSSISITPPQYQNLHFSLDSLKTIIFGLNKMSENRIESEQEALVTNDVELGATSNDKNESNNVNVNVNANAKSDEITENKDTTLLLNDETSNENKNENKENKDKKNVKKIKKDDNSDDNNNDNATTNYWGVIPLSPFKGLPNDKKNKKSNDMACLAKKTLEKPWLQEHNQYGDGGFRAAVFGFNDGMVSNLGLVCV